MAVSNYPTPVLHALKLLRANPHYLEDARQGSLVGNSIAGSVLALTLEVPREYAEHAVREALSVLEASNPNPKGRQRREHIDALRASVGASYAIRAVSTDETPIDGTPDQVLYGDEPRIYGTREEAEEAAEAWNREAESEGWGWRYVVERATP